MEVKMNDKCVYLHKDKEGIVRYVGSGTSDRAYRTTAGSFRGKRYAEYVETNGRLEVEIVAEGLTKIEAENLEREFYDRHSATLLNHRRPASYKPMAKEIFEAFFYYDETSPSCLRWKVDRLSANNRVNVKSGEPAGRLKNAQGYYSVMFNEKTYSVHRIIAVLHDIDVDGYVIDHIDRNRSNNRISNLRVVTQKQNCQNMGISSRNSSGVIGVTYLKSGYWVAQWNEGGKQKSKCFPIKDCHSPEESFQAAYEYRKQMVELHYN